MFSTDDFIKMTNQIMEMQAAGIDTTALMSGLTAMMNAAATENKTPDKIEPLVEPVSEGSSVLVYNNTPKEAAGRTDYYKYFSAGNVDCVTSEQNFYDDNMYTVLYKSIPNEVLQGQIKHMLEQKAKSIGGTSLVKMFNQNCTAKKRAAKKEREEIERNLREAEEARQKLQVEEDKKRGWKTNFKNLPDWCTGNKYIGQEWTTSNNDGAYRVEETSKSSKTIIACGRPVLINRLLTPIDEESSDGIERVELGFEGEHGWKRRVVEREQLLNKNKAISLANFGVDVTSETAGAFTGFMSSMLKESSIRNAIPEILSARKLAMYRNNQLILPYRNENFFFERKADLPHLVNALQPHGDDENMQKNEKEWYSRFKKIRAQKIQMFNFLTASTLCAPILGMLDSIDGFVCNVVGMTGCGKSVAEKINATIWGSYKSKAGFVYGAKNTSTMLETCADVMNCLPLIIDDYEKLDEKEKEKFKQTIYDIANGTGKGRANKNLGLRCMLFWNLNLIVTSENPVRERAGGGAVNRLISCMADDKCPWEPEEISDMMQFFGDNYGHAGKKYIDILNKKGKDKISDMIKKHRTELMEAAKNQKKTIKQINAMAIILTADEIAADELFEDGIKISVEQAVNMLDEEEIIKNEAKFYDYVIDKIYSNPRRFQGLVSSDMLTNEMWGKFVRNDSKEQKVTLTETITVTENGVEKEIVKSAECYPTTIAIFPNTLRAMAKEAGASFEMFLGYLEKNGLLYAERGRKDKKVSFMRTDGQPGENRARAIKFRIPQQDNVPFTTD